MSQASPESEAASAVSEQPGGSRPLAPLRDLRWEGGLLGAGEPEPVGQLRPEAEGAWLVICDHAGKRIPAALDGLGLDPAALERHVAYDIGALGVAEVLAERLGAELIFQRYSRLVVDCNRPPHEPSAFVARGDGIEVPGNRDLAPADVARRLAEVFHPYHARIGWALERRLARGLTPVLLSVHSFTPIHGDHPGERPWELGLLFNRDARLAEAVARRLEGTCVVGLNQPYQVTDAGDYAIPIHGEARGLPHIEFEIRQDLIESAEGQAAWGERLAKVLPAALADLQ